MITRFITLLATAAISMAALSSSTSAQTVTQVSPSAANSLTPSTVVGTTSVGANVTLPAGTPGSTTV